MQPERGIEGTRPPAGGKKEPSGLFFSVRVPIFRNVYRGCCCLGAHVQRIFYLTRTGIATMTTAACGRNRESLLGPWLARRERRPRHEADAGSHNPAGRRRAAP